MMKMYDGGNAPRHAIIDAAVARQPPDRSGIARGLLQGASMTKHRTHKMNGVARPIKTKKDYSAAASVIEKIGDKPDPETIAEKRLQSLLKAMEKFDDETDDPDSENSDPDYAGPLRRWSDEPGESE